MDDEMNTQIIGNLFDTLNYCKSTGSFFAEVIALYPFLSAIQYNIIYKL